MSLEQVVGAGDSGNAADVCSRRLIIQYVSHYPCALTAVEVDAACYDDERECQTSERWLEANEDWKYGSDKYELVVDNVGEDQWWVAWRQTIIDNEQMVNDLRRLYFPSPAMSVVWIEAVKGEAAAEHAAHEESLLKRLNRSVTDVIILDSDEDTEEEEENAGHELVIGPWRPSGKTNTIRLYFEPYVAHDAVVEMDVDETKKPAELPAMEDFDVKGFVSGILDKAVASADAETAAVAALAEKPHELAKVGQRVSIKGAFGVVWKVTKTRVAVAFDSMTWEAMTHARFSKHVFRELNLSPDNAVVGVLHSKIDKLNYITAFLYESAQTAVSWRLYNRYVPAGDGRQFAPPPFPFPLAAGDSIEVNQSVLPILVGKRPILAALGNQFTFIGLVIGQIPFEREEHVWAVVCTKHS